MNKSIRKAIAVLCTCIIYTYSNALSPGDIAIIGYNYDKSPQEMTLAILAPLPAGTVIWISDYSYDEGKSGFDIYSLTNVNEGSIKWTTSSAIEAGSIIKFTIASGTTPTVTGLPGTIVIQGWTNTNTTRSPAPETGDNWFIYQGDVERFPSTYIFGWTNPSLDSLNGINQPAGQFLVPGSGKPTLQSSYLPSALKLGTTAIALNRDPARGGYHGDNNVYTGPRSGNKGQLLAEICKPSNWKTNETTTYDISAGGTNFPGSNPVFTVTNKTPADIALSATSVNENVAANTTVGTLTSTDPDVGDSFTYALVAGTGSTDNTSFNISGNSLRITNSPDFETKSSYSIRVRTTDQGNLYFEKVFTVSVSDINDAPLNITLSASSVIENASANTTVGTFSSKDEDAGNTFTYTLVVGTGSTDNASFNISGNSLRITNSPDFETKSNYNIRVRTKDQGGLTFEKAFTVTITNVNEAPADIALSATSVNENAAANTTVGAMTSTDADAGNTFTYTLVAGTGSTDNASFNINGNSLRITDSPDFETKSSYNIRVRTKDQGGLTFEKAFTVTITNVNEAPADIALSDISVDENVAANTTVVALSSTDEDAGDTFTYALVAGTGSTNNTSFNILGSSLRITDSPDFETNSSYSIRVRTTDQGGLTFEKVLIVNINNLNEAPIDIALSATSLNENVAANTTVGALSSTDDDAGNTFTYTLVSGTGSTDNASFNISGNSLRITNSPDFETTSSYNIRVRTKDQSGFAFEKAFTVTITNVNEAPADIALSADSVNENAAANTTVGALSSTDADADNTFTYTLVAGTGSTDNAFFNIIGNSLRITNSPDFETKSSYNIRVRTKDQGGLTFEKEFIIKITDLNETITSVYDQTQGRKINLLIYPNPVTDQLNISVEKDGIYTIKLIDQTGALSLITELSGKEIKIDISQLSQGFYTLIVNDNTETINRKFIIAK